MQQSYAYIGMRQREGRVTSERLGLCRTWTTARGSVAHAVAIASSTPFFSELRAELGELIAMRLDIKARRLGGALPS
ncbi:hypothetical protein ACFVJ4_21610 [Streptomyces sp. NPDC127178]|uniref:hypothetical protein n=1 Tax=unclassified Streptomyces TaxID=2593676 RepID=UPI00363431AA